MNINRVVLTGNLTVDPEVRPLPSGTSVGRLRLAVNTRRKNGQTGEWEEKPNYFDVTVWGAQAERCAQYLTKGRPVAVDGRLEWREWEQDGQKRQAVQVIAENVQFLGGREQSGGNGFGNTSALGSVAPAPSDTGDFAAPPAAATTTTDDDIPF